MHTRQEIINSINHLWKELDKIWDGDKRPKNWDITCEQMAILTESLGLKYNKDGDLK